MILFIDGVNLKGTSGKFAKAYPSDVCSAMRCKEAPVVKYAKGTGGEEELSRDVYLCDRHQRAYEDAEPEYPRQGIHLGLRDFLSEGEEQKSDALEDPEIVETQEDLETLKQSLAQIETDSRDALTELANFVVEDDQDAQCLTEILAETAQKKRGIEEERKKATGPLNTALKQINNWFRPAREQLEAQEKRIKGLILDYRRVRAAEQARQIAAANEAAEQGDMEGLREHALAAAEAQPAKTAATVKVVWRFEVQDLSKVPREFMVPDEKAIRAYVKDLKDMADIPGVRIWSEETLCNPRTGG